MFTMGLGTYRHSCTLFGIRSLPDTFWRVLNIIQFEIRWKTYLAEIDDAVIFSMIKCEHFKDTENVLTLHCQPKRNSKTTQNVTFLSKDLMFWLYTHVSVSFRCFKVMKWNQQRSLFNGWKTNEIIFKCMQSLLKIYRRLFLHWFATHFLFTKRKETDVVRPYHFGSTCLLHTKNGN